MAKTKKSGGEASTPLIISLVFFILVAIGLGVMYYLSNDAIAAEKAKATEAENKAKTADKSMKEAQDIAKLYRMLLGTATEDEKAYMANPAPETKDAVKAEHGKLIAALNAKIAAASNKERAALEKLGAGFDLSAVELFTWNWPDGGALPASPLPLALADRMVKLVAERERTVKQSEIEVTNARTELAALTAEKKRYTDAIAAGAKSVADEVKKLSDEKMKLEGDLKGKITAFEAEADKLRKDQVLNGGRVEEIQLEMKKLAERLSNVSEQLKQKEAIQAELDSQKKGAFAYNPPHGEIVTRRGDTKMVEINIGSAANLKQGQTFKVQPASTLTEGLGSRKKQTTDTYGNVVTSDEEVSKGTIEVVRVLGPNLAEARITSEPEEIRDSILKGDLLYNPLWKKGSRDRVVLYGIFDINGDGQDDIQSVVRDLERQGVIVDGYFNLSTRKWESLDPNNKKPGPTQSTTYAVKGWIPESSSALADKVAAVAGAINTAGDEAKAKGCKEVKALEFFPAIGIKISPNASDATAAQAAVKYLRDEPAPQGK